MGLTLTPAATMLCPHGGTVTGIPSGSRVLAGTPVLTTVDTFLVAGCPFTLPGPASSPCVTVRWVVPDRRTTVGGAPTLSTDSVGLCLSAAQAPQGTVIVAATQTRVTTL